ncbi:phosphate binding ABC transporter [Streptomyces davaonensis JCM 4913]|uniref:Phosphate binding ABC transporter n=1 Tax=Streptomyces davaonensis (strain DSM 101723 / JCM 4913 / KCC S-0913 / 768) TaxID=1214101 RepID=K4R621_STRDJ|nr:substrate-binding domain-containing protein [Streptomyces davaonensis]CCK28562.1 phosphate binding ABC transporter [Streptomyces davaonensis JCM 4913]
MELLSAENVVAVATAVAGIVASAVMVWYERRVPRRKRIGYRVQMDNPIGDDVTSGRANVRLGLFDEAPGMHQATLVLLRVENDGSQGIGHEDYTSRELHGLTVQFTDRSIRGVSVTQPPGTDHLMSHFTPHAGFGYDNGGNTLRIPRVPLNRGEHFKLLVLLSGGDVGRDIRLIGGIRDGEVHPNRSATPDDKPPLFSRAARLITIMLTVSVLTLSTMVVVRDDTPPLGCEKGTLTITGSTAFAPVVRDLEKDYEKDCEGAEITVEDRGSSAGVGELAALKGESGSRRSSMIAFHDGASKRAGDELTPQPIAVSVFTLVVNDSLKLPAGGLSLADVRSVYAGEIDYWDELDPSLPHWRVVLVSRDADSGTRQVFQDQVLGGAWEGVPSTSLDCDIQADRSAPVRCELDSTEEVLEKAAAIRGAIGYSELNLATGRPDVVKVPLEGATASVEAIERPRTPYPYYGVEYAYTYGDPQGGTLAGSFLDYIRDHGEAGIQDHDHVPCTTPEGERLCGGTG